MTTHSMRNSTYRTSALCRTVVRGSITNVEKNALTASCFLYTKARDFQTHIGDMEVWPWWKHHLCFLSFLSCCMFTWLVLCGCFHLDCVCPYLCSVLLVSSKRLGCLSFASYCLMEFFYEWRLLICILHI